MNNKAAMMRKNVLMIVAVFLCVSLFANEELTGKVVAVIDGNTIEMMTADNEKYTILLQGIDSPELEQEYGDKAKKYLEKLLLEKAVLVKIQGKDRRGTRFGLIIIEGKPDPRLVLLEEGLAWTSEKDPATELELIKENAREKGKGLWKTESPTPPWIFRRQQTMMQAKSSG